jgi:hypothetical protein
MKASDEPKSPRLITQLGPVLGKKLSPELFSRAERVIDEIDRAKQGHHALALVINAHYQGIADKAIDDLERVARSHAERHLLCMCRLCVKGSLYGAIAHLNAALLGLDIARASSEENPSAA